MSYISWTQSLSVNVSRFDSQHKVLVDIINELYCAMKTGIGNELHGMIINRLVSYTVTHFSDEESLMATYDYPETTIHKAEHYRFVKQVRELQKQHESGVAILSLEIMMFLKEWLMRHIQGDDKKYGVFLNKNGFAK